MSDLCSYSTDHHTWVAYVNDVKDKLPRTRPIADGEFESSDKVLGWQEYFKTWIVVRFIKHNGEGHPLGGSWWDGDEENPNGITHWMALPTSPIEEKT